MSDTPSVTSQPNAIEMRGIVKRFPGVIANNGIELSVARGEIHGLLGENGAGKSTLLKVLTRITHPTEGRAELTGSVGSLLEVGTGFHPELTGDDRVHRYFLAMVEEASRSRAAAETGG
mgnify:CR=1 FL=1